VIISARALVLSCLASFALCADVLNIDDGEKAAGGWQGRADGKLAAADVRTTFNTAKLGEGSILTSYRKQKGGWCSLGRAINADWTAFACMRFWVKMVGVKELEVRLTDTGNENFIAKVTAKIPGEWEYVALPFANFVRNAGYQAQGAATDGKLDLIKITDLNISPLGEGEGRFWLDQVDVAIIPEAQSLAVPPMPIPPAKLFELDAPLAKKSTKVDVDSERIGGRLSPWLATGWGEDVGEFADNQAWSDLVKAAGFPLLRINARLDRLTRDGVYDTWLLEKDLAALKAVGANALVVLDGTPAALGKTSRDNPTDVNAWADLCASVVQRINIDQKHAVPVWQIWNDADVKTSWTGTPEEYGALVSRAAERMKRVDPSITVLAGGLSRASGVRAIGQQSVGLDPSVDGLAWSSFAFEKIADGNAGEALERTWGFERTFLQVADLSRSVARPLLSAVSLRVAAERTVYNPRLDSIFGPVYLASSINHLARQNAFLGCWQNATPQRTAGLIDANGKQRPLVAFMSHFNAAFKDHQWYWVASESGTAQVETLAAVSGGRFVLLLVNKDSTGGQYDVTLKFNGMKPATGSVWTLGRGIEAGEEKPMAAGGTKLLLPPTSVTIVAGALTDPSYDPAQPPEVAGGGRTLATVRYVDKQTKTLYADDKEGRTYVVSVGDVKPTPKKAEKGEKGEATAERPFLPGMQLEITGKKKAPFIIAEKCVVQGETASVPTTSDSGFNLAERIKGKPVLTAEHLKAGFDPNRIPEMPGKPSLAFVAKQIQGVKIAMPQDSDFSAKIRVAWNEENLFVVAIIQDEAVITVVLGFDMGIDSSAGTNDENDTQIVGYAKDKKGVAITPIAMGKKGGTFGGLKYTRPNNEGHTFFFTIPWTTLGFVPEAGRRFGFNIVLTDSDKDKEAGGFFEWAGGMSNVTLNAEDFSQFGILELK
jgi:Carbohydrate binding domain (family 11)/Carbohydrate family 9 binding domain-like